MFLMRSSRQKGDLHIRNPGTGQNSSVRLFFQMGQNQALPVPIQHIFAAVRCKLEARSPLSRLQQKVYFRIMPKRFIMPHAFHRLLNCLFIDNLPFSELHRHFVPLFNNTAGEFRSAPLPSDARIFHRFPLPI